jgi:hypothetical protein
MLVWPWDLLCDGVLVKHLEKGLVKNLELKYIYMLNGTHMNMSQCHWRQMYSYAFATAH